VEALKKSPDVSGAVVYVISDFQRADWCGDDPSQPSSADDKSLLAPLVEWAADDRGLRLTLINVADKDPRNVAILNAVIRGGPVVAGAPSVLSTVVTACGASEYENIPLQTSVGGVPQPPKTIRRLEPGQRATVDLEVSFPRPGFESVRIDASVDGLPADNVRYYAEEVFEAIRVLLVNGEPGEIAREDEVALMATALRPEGLVFSGVETTIVDEGGLDGEDLSRFHLVVLANVYRLSDVALGSLEEFTQNGGGLLVFLGDQVDADWYNASLYRNGEGILPAELGAVIKIAGQARLVIENRLHPVFLAMAGAEDPLGIGRIPFFDYIECRPFEGTPSAGETDVDDNAETGPDTSLPAQVIARFEHAEKHPALIERSFGKGRTILITTSADKEWNFWPDHPTFLPAMLELVRHVARRPHRPENQWVGLPLNVPLDAERYESRVMVRTPAYPAEQEIAANAVPLENGSGLTVPWEHTETSGIYQFVLTPRSGGETTMLAAVNLDPRESDLTRAGEEDLRKSLSGASFEYVEDVDGLVGGEGESRTELWRIVLLTAVAMLMLEQTLAFAWGKRR